MSMTDSLADMLTRIRNGQQARLYSVQSPSSKLRLSVLEVLKREGYIEAFEEQGNENGSKDLKIILRYMDGEPVIHEVKRISKPGRRVYSKIKKLQKAFNGLGVAVLSTSRGVMSDFEARKANIGGEILCVVF